LQPGFDTQALGLELDVDIVEEIPGFPGHYLILTNQTIQGPYETLTEQLTNDHRVIWAEQQFHKVRVKRDHLDDLQEMPSLRNLEDLIRLKSIPENLLQLWKEEEAYDGVEIPEQVYDMFNDELWDHQWYLHDTRARLDTGLPDISLHVVNAWKMGITGDQKFSFAVIK